MFVAVPIDIIINVKLNKCNFQNLSVSIDALSTSESNQNDSTHYKWNYFSFL